MIKKIAIMQPYIFPYIGYFHLINSVDEFIIYDNIQYTKKGWINRNRILSNGEDTILTFPLKKDSDYLDVKDRILADVWDKEKIKLLNKIQISYKNSPEYNLVYPIIEECILHQETNLFKFILKVQIVPVKKLHTSKLYTQKIKNKNSAGVFTDKFHTIMLGSTKGIKPRVPNS